MTVTELMTLEQAREFLRAAVETHGRDFIYNVRGGPCYYTARSWSAEDDDPKTKTGCLVGVALSLAGRTQAELNAQDHGIVDRMEELRLTEEAATYLGIAQGVQDSGKSWGSAYDRAEGWVRRER